MKKKQLKKAETGGMANPNQKVSTQKSATKYTGGKNANVAVKPKK